MRGVRAPCRRALVLLSLALGSLALGAGRPGLAQEPEPDTAAAAPGSSITVYLVTIGPGRRIWERFGHNALLVRDTLRGIDRAYNYGMFSFEQEGFLKRFVQGEMQYWVAAFQTERLVQGYREADRSIWLSELELTPEQRVDLLAYLEWNERPENRFYRYDYYLDNCSTRVRDALDRVLGGRLTDLTAEVETGTTYRSHTRRLLAPDLVAYVGTLLSLGQPVDRPISAWEEMYLPGRMMETFRGITVRDAEGREVPFVRGEFTVFESTMPLEREGPPDWLLGFLAVGVALAAGILLTGRYGSTRRGLRIVWLTGTSLWALVLGVGGAFLVLVWALTAHWAGYWNENLFFFNPLALPLALLLPIAAAGSGWAARWALRLAVTVAALSVLGFAVQLLPWFGQVNGEIIAAVLPPNLAMGWAIHRTYSGRWRDEVPPGARTEAQ